MRFTLDSASDVSADEQSSPTVVRTSLPHQALSRAKQATHPHNFASSSTSTQTPTRKGILRHTSSYTSTASNGQRRQRFQDGSDQDDGPKTQSAQQETEQDTPRSRTHRAPSISSPHKHTRRRSATPSFELVGLPSPSASSSRFAADSPGPSSLQRQTTPRASASLPPWMRPSHQLHRGQQLDDDLDSSDEDHAALSSSDEDASGDDNDDSDGSSSPQTSPYDQEDSSDSEEAPWPVEGPVTSSSRLHRTSSRSKASRRRGSTPAVNLASIAGDDWEEWNRHSAQLAWHRARANKLDLASSDAISARTSRSRSATATLAPDTDVDEVQALLSSLNMRRTQEEAEVKKAFEARNKDLWSGIDACILAAETEARKAAAAEAARLEAARKSQEEAERKAAQARQAELDRIEAEKKAAQAEAEQRKMQQEAEAAKQKQDAAEQEKLRAMGGTGDDIRKAALAEYDEWMTKIRHIKTDVLPTISANPDLRKQCFAAKRQITPKIGQLTNSRQEITRITLAIASVLDAAKQASSTTGNHVYTWILNHLSKCLIRQAEQEVAAKQDTAYPLARVVVWLLLLGHVELGEVLMGRLCKKCPWVVAVWPGRGRDVDEAAYRKVMGYKTQEETTENYSNRMNGIVAFYFAILQTVPTAPPGSTALEVERIPLHFRSTTIWRWTVRAITPSSSNNAFLDHPMCPSIWSVFIEIAGEYALKVYGKQMRKIFGLLLKEGVVGKRAGWWKHADDKPYVKAATVRLELLLMDWSGEPGQMRVKGATRGVEMEP
ncbi:Nucleoporin GLE1 [Pseudozyma hubeiensis]|nr:Nucleoporin GLE1 [Pseudozyma hubeiensis]